MAKLTGCAGAVTSRILESEGGMGAPVMVQCPVATPESHFNESMVNFGAPDFFSGPIRLNLA